VAAQPLRSAIATAGGLNISFVVSIFAGVSSAQPASADTPNATAIAPNFALVICLRRAPAKAPQRREPGPTGRG
jgi:hypothetical protein